MILADGMGSGVKANILSTLTAKILGTMFLNGATLEECVETIMQTLPICQIRQVAYATFSSSRYLITERLTWWNMIIPAVFLSGTGK